MNKIIENACLKLISLFVRTLGLLPRKAGIRLGILVGNLLFLVDKRHRKVAVQNLANAYQNEKSLAQIEILVKKIFKDMGKLLFEVCWSWSLNKTKLFRHFRIEGFANMDNAYKKGKGVILLTGHVGNWELMSVIGAKIYYPINVIYRPLDFKPLDEFLKKIRSRFGAKLIGRRKAIRKILKSLNNGEVVSILLDQNVDWYEGVFVDFFGQRACTNTAMARLALKTEAPVVPVFLIRDKNGFTAKFFPEIPLAKTGDKIKDIEINTEKYNKALERIIRQHPEQWFWVHRRWKTKPYQLLQKTGIAENRRMNAKY